MKTEEIKTWQDRITTPTTNQKNLFMSMQAEIDELREKLADHKAARIAYASEFPKDAEGEPDVGNIHANIRALKTKLAALEVLYLNSLADATQWQLYKSRKDTVIAGMGKKAMRDSAAGAEPVQRMTGAALASQEPVAEVLLVDGEKVIDASMAFFDSVELGTKLYLAAGAAPKEPT